MPETPEPLIGRLPVAAQAAPPEEKPRANVPFATHELLVSVAAVVVDKWEKMSVWILAALAAASGVAVANYDKISPIIGARTIRAMWWLLLVSVLLHAAQKVATTLVQAAEAGAVAGKAIDPPVHVDDLPAFLAGMVAAYPRFVGKRMERMYARLLTEGPASFSKTMMRIAFFASGCAVVQLLVGFAAVLVIAISLY